MGFYDKVKTDKGVINVLNAIGSSGMNYQANNYVRTIGLGTNPNISNVSKKYTQYKILGYETDVFSLLDESKITSTNWVTLLTFDSGAIIRAKKNDYGDIVEIYGDNKTVTNLYYSSSVRFSAYKNQGYKCFIVYFGTTTMFISPDIIATGASPSSPKQVITWENLPQDYEPVLVYFVKTNKGIGEYIDNTYITWTNANTENFVWDYKNRAYNSYTSDSYPTWDLLRRTFYGKVNPSFEDFNSTTGGGDGDYMDDSSDAIELPNIDLLNVNSISNTKFFSCYKMTPEQLSVLSEHLWTDWRNIAELIGNSILKPLDFIISLNMLPVNVESTQKVIKMGWFDLNHAVQGGLINQQYVRINCGSIEVKKKWGGAIDYQTDISLFLPFIGEVTLNANEVMGATLTIIYTVDVMSGNCIASVQVVKDNLNAILYQYNGNVASNFSITSLDYSNVMAGALQLAVAVGTGGGAGAGAFTAAVSSASNLLSGAEVRRAGNLSATSGFMGIKKPYLILSRPIQSLPSEYNTFRGYVSNITLALSECSGFTKVAEIHLENIPATSAELDELDGLLKAGVIF